ncbi:unnamed protein product [Eruca vesicaria subsp. sativa]|uniref:Uncharacterized protein n=1 Tax=Eruca vesicaria subsp. sativa TaxID=29727 RepID=A0ABC8JLY4_ERUVS|nr:unnamed protein product [Eruca vesicaria subsp. sativa]
MYMTPFYLIVQPMMEPGEEVPEGWGEWDDEIDDRRVKYMVGLIEGGHSFKKSEWGGGDAQEKLYDHEAQMALKKRKREVACVKKLELGGPPLKQKRLSTYFGKRAVVDGEECEKCCERMAKLEKTVSWMMKRMPRRKRGGTTPKKDVFLGGKSLGKRRFKNSPGKKDEPFIADDIGGGEIVRSLDIGRLHSDGGNDGGDVSGDVNDLGTGPVVEGKVEGVFVDEDEEAGGSIDGEEFKDMVDEVEVSVDSEENVVREDEKVGVDVVEPSGEVDVEGSSSEGNPDVLAPLKEGDGVPIQWIEQGVSGLRGTVLYRATTANTFYVTEDEVCSSALGLSSVGVSKSTDVSVSSPGPCTETGEGVNDDDVEKTPSEEKPLEGSTGLELQCTGVPKITDLSDSSPCPRSEKHRPAESEANLASLLLAKEPFTLAQIVPSVEDADYSYFEKVLLENPKVLHLGAGKYDLDNQFFLDLAASQKWVSSKFI